MINFRPLKWSDNFLELYPPQPSNVLNAIWQKSRLRCTVSTYPDDQNTLLSPSLQMKVTIAIRPCYPKTLTPELRMSRAVLDKLINVVWTQIRKSCYAIWQKYHKCPPTPRGGMFCKNWLWSGWNCGGLTCFLIPRISSYSPAPIPPQGWTPRAAQELTLQSLF